MNELRGSYLSGNRLSKSRATGWYLGMVNYEVLFLGKSFGEK